MLLLAKFFLDKVANKSFQVTGWDSSFSAALVVLYTCLFFHGGTDNFWGFNQSPLTFTVFSSQTLHFKFVLLASKLMIKRVRFPSKNQKIKSHFYYYNIKCIRCSKSQFEQLINGNSRIHAFLSCEQLSET